MHFAALARFRLIRTKHFGQHSFSGPCKAKCTALALYTKNKGVSTLGSAFWAASAVLRKGGRARLASGGLNGPGIKDSGRETRPIEDAGLGRNSRGDRYART